MSETKNLTVMGNTMEKYTVIIPRYNVSFLVVRRVKALCERVSEATGKTFVYKKDFEAPISDFEIVVGHCDRDGAEEITEHDAYRIHTCKEKVLINGGRNYSTVYALDLFEKMLFDGKITDGTDICGKYEDGADDYHLRWNDDFDADKIDEKTWHCKNQNCGNKPRENGRGYGSWYGMNTARSTKPENLHVDNGCLYLTATHDDETFYGAWADTSKSFEFAKGYMEISCRLADGEGLWHDFWTWSNENEHLEFDISECEGMGDNFLSVIHEISYLRRPAIFTSVEATRVRRDDVFRGERYKNFMSEYSYDREKSMNNEFHTIGAEWTDTDVRFYRDGEEVYSHVYAGSEWEYLYSKPHYFILSMLVGSNYGNRADDCNDKYLGIKRPRLEGDYWGNDRGSFIIDYIELFQKDGQYFKTLTD